MNSLSSFNISSSYHDQQFILEDQHKNRSTNDQGRPSFIKRIQTIALQNNQLEGKTIILQNEIIDLRALLFLIGEQSLQELTSIYEKNTALSFQLKAFQSALKICHQKGNHFQNISLYWSQFL